jgi:hypothetical protein
MIEELQWLSRNEDVLVGRCIHFDILGTAGSSLDSAQLRHIDLATNVYMDTDARDRMSVSLAGGGQVTDATFRTHVLRIDEARGSVLPRIIEASFVSKALMDDLFADQFSDASSD